jgi:hypothetical protein
MSLDRRTATSQGTRSSCVRVVSFESVSGSLLGRAPTVATDTNRLRLLAIVVCPHTGADAEDRGNRLTVRGSLAALGWVNINGWRMRSVYFPPETNDGSAFMHHVVLIWTVGQHTYGVGFHNIKGLRRTLLLDEGLAKHIKLVRP